MTPLTRRFPGRTPLRGLTAFVALVVTLGGCSGIDPQPIDEPPDPESPCNVLPQVYNAFPSGAFGVVGADSTFELAAWNIQNFPKAGTGTIDRVVDIVNTLDIDLYCLQEIEDTTGFRTLLNRLPDHGGLYSPDVYNFGSYQKTGVLYRKDVLTLNSWRVPPEFLGNNYAFPRPPLEVDFTARGGGAQYRFKVIVLHLKAGMNNADDQARRRAATSIMHNYLEARAVIEPDMNYIVAGDWNDVLTDQVNNSFEDFLADSGNFLYLTTALIPRPDLQSHPIGLIDHIMVTRSACPEFANGRITTLRLDLLYPTSANPSYGTFVSDHRPVVAVFPAFR
jgi:endonuclease/exonuclease/phosphatase family metal-dependent hydrolase